MDQTEQIKSRKHHRSSKPRDRSRDGTSHEDDLYQVESAAIDETAAEVPSVVPGDEEAAVSISADRPPRPVEIREEKGSKVAVSSPLSPSGSSSAQSSVPVPVCSPPIQGGRYEGGAHDAGDESFKKRRKLRDIRVPEDAGERMLNQLLYMENRKDASPIPDEVLMSIVADGASKVELSEETVSRLALQCLSKRA